MKRLWIAVVIVFVVMLGSNGVVAASGYEEGEYADIFSELELVEVEADGYVTEDMLRSVPETVDATVGDVIYKVYTQEDGTLALYSCSGQVETLVIPESINGITVTGIGEWFWERSTLENLKVVEIPDTVTTLGKSAFEGCATLTNVKLPEGIEELPRHLLYNCTSLESVNIPNSVTTLGRAVFYGCASITEIELPSGLTFMDEWVFGYCTNLKSVVIPESVITISSATFYECSSLERVELPGTVTAIANYMFYGCSSLENIVLTDMITSIGKCSFYGCSSFETVKILDSVTHIGEWAFSHCKKLKSFEFPKNVTIMEDHVLSCCELLESVTIPERVTNIDYRAFYGCKSLAYMAVPKCVESIGEEAFVYCSGLKDIVIPKSVKSIGANAFKGTASGMKVHCIKYSVADNASLYPDGVVFVYEEDTSPLRDFVERMYTVALGREADEDGADFWEEKLLSRSRDGAGLAQGFILSTEFKGNGYGDNEFVEILYRTFFDRAGDEAGIAHWVNAIRSGTSREAVLAGFVNSAEFDELCTYYGISRGVLREDGNALNPGIVLFAKRLYTKVLGRTGDKTGIEYWAMQIADGLYTPEEAAESFFFSAEYVEKETSNASYIRTLYLTFMDREADAAGLNYWKSMLEDGESRESVLHSFAASPEFQTIMVEYGL